jgi:hypothetical protein
MMMHDLVPEFFIWPTFQGQRSKLEAFSVSWHILLVFELECSNHVWTCMYFAWSDIKYGHLGIPILVVFSLTALARML